MPLILDSEYGIVVRDGNAFFVEGGVFLEQPNEIFLEGDTVVANGRIVFVPKNQNITNADKWRIVDIVSEDIMAYPPHLKPELCYESASLNRN